MKLQFKLGVSTKHRAISIQFERPTQQLVMPVATALELCKRIMVCAKDIQSSDEQRRAVEAIIKEIQ